MRQSIFSSPELAILDLSQRPRFALRANLRLLYLAPAPALDSGNPKKSTAAAPSPLKSELRQILFTSPSWWKLELRCCSDLASAVGVDSYAEEQQCGCGVGLGLGDWPHMVWVKAFDETIANEGRLVGAAVESDVA